MILKIRVKGRSPESQRFILNEMELILLPGNGTYNREWIYEVEKKFSDLFDKTRVQSYRHWKNGNNLIHLDYELEVLSDYVYGRKNYCIFAKSMGSVLAIKGVKEGKIKSKSNLFCGLPVLWAREKGIDIDKIIENYDGSNTVFVQNDKDPCLESRQVLDYFEDRNVKYNDFIELIAEGHDYNNLDYLYSIMKTLI